MKYNFKSFDKKNLVFRDDTFIFVSKFDIFSFDAIIF